MAKSSIKKDIVSVYKKHAMGLKTIIYCVNVKHAEELKEVCKSGVDSVL